MPHRRLISGEKFTDWVGRLIKKHKAQNYGSELFGKNYPKSATDAKNWSHPKVRKTLEYILNRRTYTNRFDTRKGFEKFLIKSYEIMALPNQNNRYILDEHVHFYLSDLIKKNKVMPSARKEFVNNVILSTELVANQAEAIIRSSREITQKDDISNNSRDALAHIGVEFHLIVSEIDNIVDSMRKYERQLN